MCRINFGRQDGPIIEGTDERGNKYTDLLVHLFVKIN